MSCNYNGETYITKEEASQYWKGVSAGIINGTINMGIAPPLYPIPNHRGNSKRLMFKKKEWEAWIKWNKQFPGQLDEVPPDNSEPIVFSSKNLYAFGHYKVYEQKEPYDATKYKRLLATQPDKDFFIKIGNEVRKFPAGYYVLNNKGTPVPLSKELLEERYRLVENDDYQKIE